MARGKIPRRLADVDPAAVEHAAGLAVLHHDVHGLAVLVQEHAPRCPAGKSFDARLAASGVQVQHPCTGQVELDDAEHRLLDLIEGGAGDIGAGQGLQPSAPCVSCNDSHVVASFLHPFVYLYIIVKTPHFVKGCVALRRQMC